MIPVEHDGEVLEKDEYIMSKKAMVEKPERFAKAFTIYSKMPGGLKALYDQFGKFIGKEFKSEDDATISLFNACPQSDGAGACLIMT